MKVMPLDSCHSNRCHYNYRHIQPSFNNLIVQYESVLVSARPPSNYGRDIRIPCSRNELTTKSYVYSIGVLLLEIVSGRRPAQAVGSVGWQKSIFEWTTPLMQSHRYAELLDALIFSSSSGRTYLVYTCTQHVPSMLHRIAHVVHQLQQLAQPPVAK